MKPVDLATIHPLKRGFLLAYEKERLSNVGLIVLIIINIFLGCYAYLHPQQIERQYNYKVQMSKGRLFVYDNQDRLLGGYYVGENLFDSIVENTNR